MEVTQSELIILGGGAAGFFAAATAAAKHPGIKIAIFEKSAKVLSKVRISGGGRCNVTHACFDPKELVKNYPRGSKELLGPFHQFGPPDIITWFESRGVALKTEEDGRIFPVSDSSESIIQCLMDEIQLRRVELHTLIKVESISKQENGFFLKTTKGDFLTKKLLLATGSSNDGHQFAKQFGHTITPLVPSLFTFNTPSSPLLDLSGISVSDATLSIEGTPLKTRGPLLLTHFGFSGPAVLRLSSIGAPLLHSMNYHATFIIDWTNGMKKEALLEKIHALKKTKESLSLDPFIFLPKNLSKRLLELLSFSPEQKFAQLSNVDVEKLIQCLTASRYQIEGKTTNKAEFVTCGGIELTEVNFKTMESKLMPGLFFAGEILNIDGITGGFNFQNAWTTAYLAA